MTTDTSRAVPPTAGPVRRQPGRAAPYAVVALAVLAAAVLRLLAGAVGVDVRVGTGGTSHGVGLGAVVAASAVAALAGLLTLRVAMRLGGSGRRWWTVLAVVVLVVSLASPLSAASVGAWAVLSLLHLVTGAVVVLGLRRTTR